MGSSFQMLHSRVGSWPYSQTLGKAWKACQEQTLKLTTFIDYGCKKDLYDWDQKPMSKYFTSLIYSKISLTRGLAYFAALVNYNCKRFIRVVTPLSCYLIFKYCFHARNLRVQEAPTLTSEKPCWGRRLSTVDLLIKVACFVTKVNNIFNVKMSWFKIVQGGQSY